jgi:hypothetical protein
MGCPVAPLADFAQVRSRRRRSAAPRPFVARARREGLLREISRSMGPPVFRFMGPPHELTTRWPEPSDRSRPTLLPADAGVAQEVPVSFRELTMVEVRDVILRWGWARTARDGARDATRSEDGASLRRGSRRSTSVATWRWTACIRSLSVQARAVREPSAERLMDIATSQWLTQKKPLRLKKVHVLLTITASRSPTRCVASRSTSLRGACASPRSWSDSLDFGLMDVMHDPETGRARRLYALVVATSSCGRRGSRRQQRSARDSRPGASSAARSRWSSPTIVDAFADYTQARGLFIDAARVASPKDKGRVENQVAYVRESWFAGEQFATSPRRVRMRACGAATSLARVCTGRRARFARSSSASSHCCDPPPRARRVRREGASRPSHPGDQGAVLGADALHPCVGMRS